MKKSTWRRSHANKPKRKGDVKERRTRRILNAIFGPPYEPRTRPAKEIALAVRREERRQRQEEGRVPRL